MADVAGVTWNDLDEDARMAVGWAAAHEPEHAVSSRGLLLGLMRARPETPPRTLLSYFDLGEGALIGALQKRQGDAHLDLSANRAQELRELPGLTYNATRILQRAAELRRETKRPRVDIECIFGGLLDTREATAAGALADVVTQVPFKAVRDSYLEWLHGNGNTYEQTLMLDRTFPSRARPATKGAPEPSTPPGDPAGPWPFLAVLRRRGTSEDGDQYRSAGLGFLISAETLITTVPPAAASDALLPVPGTEHAISARYYDEPIATLGLSPPLTAREVVARIEVAQDGQTCFVAAVDDSFPQDITLLRGTVRVLGEPAGVRFVVDLRVGLSETRISMGSPVVTADGAVVGIVAPTSATQSVDALGHHAIERARDAAGVATHDQTAAIEASDDATPTTGTLSGAGNDAVGDVDQLGFTTYVTAFADLITSPHTQPPLTIGIFGSWGMGKSFLLTHIEREIERRQEANAQAIPKVHVVRFNAWEYSSMDVVWPALVRTIVSRLDKLDTWPWYRRLLTRVRWNLARQWRELWPKLIAGAIVVAALIVTAVMNGESNVAKAIGGVAAALGVAGVLKAAKDPVANWVTALFADSDYGDQLRVMKDIKHDLTTLEERLHEGGDPNEPVTGRILILIDDLDRCEPVKAVEVLQALNLLLNFNSFVVVLGIDARIVTGAVEKHYEGLLGKAGASGYEYLDKIVQIPFRIPEPGRADVITFVAGQLGNPEKPAVPRETEEQPAEQPATGTNEAQDAPDADVPVEHEPEQEPEQQQERTPEEILLASVEQMKRVERDIHPPPEVPFTYAEQQAFELFADHLRPNPRHLKRLVNVYRLVRALARAQNEPLILARPAATIRWLVMWSQWPYASLAMVDRYEQLFDEHGDKLADEVSTDEPMLHLLDAIQAGLDGATASRLDDDHDDLHKLLSIPDCGLTWDEIRRIRRFTVNFNPAVEEQVRQPAPATAPTAAPPTG